MEHAPLFVPVARQRPAAHAQPLRLRLRILPSGHLISGLLASAALASSFFLASCEDRRPTIYALEPTTVETITAAASDISVTHEWVATLDGSANVIIRPQVSGYILRQAYADGSIVHKGDLLFEIDARPFTATLEQARAKLSQAQAQAGKTALDVKRYKPLADTEAISRQELDDAVQADLAAKAAVDAAAAQVDKATIDIGFTKVIAPIDGLAGQSKVNVGDLVSGLSLELATISAINPIRAYFSASEQEYLAYKQNNQSNSAAPEAAVASLPLSLVLSDGSTFAQRGAIEFVDRQVDTRTGSIRLAARFPNPENQLRPGMFARLRAVTEVRRAAISIPQRAVIEIQGTYQVLVYSPDAGTAAMRPVKVGERIGAKWVILEGLTAGEQVIVEGIQKTRPGAPLRAKPYGAEKAEGLKD